LGDPSAKLPFVRQSRFVRASRGYERSEYSILIFILF
jgi:hypothetical protein